MAFPLTPSTEGVVKIVQFEPHQLRGQVLREVHARPYSAIEAPRRVFHFAFMTDTELADRDRTALTSFCESNGQRGPDLNSKHHKMELANCTLRWEQHTEFTTYSWGFKSTDKTPFDSTPTKYMQIMSLLPQPGPHLVSIDLHYTNGRSLTSWRNVFDVSSLAACHTLEGNAIAATDFKVTADGFVRILVMGNKLEASRAGALVLQLLELETYRSISLLGLPIAQILQPNIRIHEAQLADIAMEMMVTTGLPANRQLLKRLMELSGKLEAEASQSQFRFGATAAYYQIVHARLQDLKEQPLPSLQTIASFMERRLEPAMRTCKSVEERLEKLSTKLSRTAGLLRTRVDIELEQQNADLLKTMNERTGLQLRLQRTVESLSVAAISYYVVQLLFYVLGPLALDESHTGKLIKSFVVVASVMCVAIVARILRRRIPND
jgi:uncharacterized membrane-anchored protein